MSVFVLCEHFSLLLTQIRFPLFFLEECLGSWFCTKKCFFFSDHSFVQIKNLEGILVSVLRTVPTCLVNGCCLGNQRTTWMTHKKSFFLCKTCRMNKHLWNTLWKKKNFCIEPKNFHFKTASQFVAFFLLFSRQHLKKHACFVLEI